MTSFHSRQVLLLLLLLLLRLRRRQIKGTGSLGVWASSRGSRVEASSSCKGEEEVQAAAAANGRKGCLLREVAAKKEVQVQLLCCCCAAVPVEARVAATATLRISAPSCVGARNSSLMGEMISNIAQCKSPWRWESETTTSMHFA